MRVGNRSERAGSGMSLGRLPQRVDGPITTAIRDAIKLRAQLLAGGTPEHEADRIVGEGLKAVLGHSRHERWRFYCDICQDRGWVNVPAEAERMTRVYGPNPQHQPVYRPCDPCRWRHREREQRRRAEGRPEEDFVMAAQVKPRRR